MFTKSSILWLKEWNPESRKYYNLSQKSLSPESIAHDFNITGSFWLAVVLFIGQFTIQTTASESQLSALVLGFRFIARMCVQISNWGLRWKPSGPKWDWRKRTHFPDEFLTSKKWNQNSLVNTSSRESFDSKNTSARFPAPSNVSA